MCMRPLRSVNLEGDIKGVLVVWLNTLMGGVACQAGGSAGGSGARLWRGEPGGYQGALWLASAGGLGVTAQLESWCTYEKLGWHVHVHAALGVRQP